MTARKQPILSPPAYALLAITGLSSVVAGLTGSVRAAERFGPALHDRTWQSFAVLCGALVGVWLGGYALALALLLLCRLAPVRPLASAAGEVLRYVHGTFTVPRLRR